MNINWGRNPHVELRSIRPGDSLMFKFCLAQKHLPDDIFIVADVCSSNRPADYRGVDKYAAKIPVVNLRTGALAYVEKIRPCYPVNAEVCVPQ